MRIFPAYYTFLGLVAAAAALGWVALGPHDLLHAVTYTENYNDHHEWVVGHTWSLSVEEQFYLIWPAVLLLAGTRRGLGIAAAFAALTPIVRIGIHYWAPAWYPKTGYTFEAVGDSIAIGCLLAGFRTQLWNTPRYRALLQSRWFWIVPATVLVISSAERPRLQELIGITLMNVGLALTIDWAVRNAESTAGRVLNAAPLVLLGQMSYSLYLWQQPFLNRSSGAAIARFPANVLLALVAASVSYVAIERPFLELRRRLESRWLPDRPAIVARAGQAPEVAVPVDRT